MRVVEVSDGEAAAAYAAKLFARWGAEVVKVESPGREAPSEFDDRYLNGGKRRVRLDLNSADGRASLADLVAGADILLTDASPIDTERWQLLGLGGGAAVRVSITPFGLSGPYRDYPATASTLLALGGYTFLSGDPGRAPLTFPGRYPYYQAATYAYTAAVAGHLRGSDPNGPMVIEVSVLETVTSLHQFTDVMWTHGGLVRSRHANRWENLCPTDMVRCRDGWVAVNIIPTFWPQFAMMLGRPELAEHPDYAENRTRMERCAEVTQMMVEAFAGKDRTTLLTEGQETWRVPIGARLTLADALVDPHLVERGFFRPFDGESRGPLTAGSPFRFVSEPLPPEPLPRRPGESPEVRWQGARSQRPLATAPPQRPLAGIRVLDLTRIWSGPLATRILGDLGAEVIKIEAPAGRGPAIVESSDGGYFPGDDPGERPWNRRGLTNKLNRNKQSLAVDLKTARGRELLLELVAVSDVVIENFSARAMPSLRLGYEELRGANPEIIYVAMPAFGLSGPYREYVGLGPSIEPLTGMNALMGYSATEPRMSVQALTDAMSGTVAASAVVTALARRRPGLGMMVELSQHECGMAHFGEQLLERQTQGEDAPLIGNGDLHRAPHGVYRCRGEDQWIAISVGSEEEWSSLCELGREGWEADAQWAHLTGRLADRERLDATVERWTRTRGKIQLMHELAAAGIAAGPVNASPEWLADPHLTERSYFFAVDELDSGRQSYDGSPLRFNGDRGYRWWLRAPGLGEHRHELLEGLLGYPAEETAMLERRGVLADRPPV